MFITWILDICLAPIWIGKTVCKGLWQLCITLLPIFHVLYKAFDKKISSLKAIVQIYIIEMCGFS